MDDESLVRRIARGLKATLLASALSMVSKGLVILVLTRYLLSPDQFGLLFYAISLLAVAELVADLGFAKSTARYISEFMETDETQVRHIIRVGLSYNLLTIGIVSVGLVLFHEQIAALLGEPALVPFLLLGPLYVAFKSLHVFFKYVFQGFNEVVYSGILTGVSSVGQLGFAVGFILLGYGTVGAFVGYATAFAVSAVLGVGILYRRFYSQLPSADSVKEDLKTRIVEYNFPLALTRGAGILDHRVDTILVGYLLTPVAVGFYTLGKQISEFIIMPAISLGFVVSPTYGSQKASDDLDRAANVYEKSFDNLLLLYVPAAAGLVLVAEPTIRYVVGTSYLGAVPVLQVLALFVVIKAIDKISNTGLDYLGRARERSIVKTAGSVGNFVLNLVLIPILGVVGAAVATVVTHACIVSVNVFLIHQELDLSVRRLALTTVRVSAITAIMAGTVWLCLPFITGLITLAGTVLAGAVVWAVLAVAGGLVDVEEIRTFVANMS